MLSRNPLVILAKLAATDPAPAGKILAILAPVAMVAQAPAGKFPAVLAPIVRIALLPISRGCLAAQKPKATAALVPRAVTSAL